MRIFIGHDCARIQFVFVIDGIENRLFYFPFSSLLAVEKNTVVIFFFFFADVFSHFLLFYFPPAYKKLYYPDIFSLNNTWVKREIGRICGELQTRAEGLTCSNPVGASLCGPRTSRGLWPGLDVAVNGGGGGCHCLSSGPSADLFPAFGGIVENLAGRSCYYRPDSVDASQPLMRRTGLSC